MFNLKITEQLNRFISNFLTISKGKAEILKSREISTLENREMESTEKPIIDSLCCPYCQSKEFVRRGMRTKKRERVQLYLCRNCQKTFTPHSIRGKHYPLATIFDAISLYNLGYSLEEACKKTNNEIGTGMSAATLSNWLAQFDENLPFSRMREFAVSKFKPEEMTISATLAHRQLYRFRFHRAKCRLLMQEHFHHSAFKPLAEFLEMVPDECPHQYYMEGLRASEAPLTFSKIAMIVRGKENYATKLAAFVLQGAKGRKDRHEILQKFMLYNDSVTVATEVPVYLTRDDLEHMKTQLGFQIFNRPVIAKPSFVEAEAIPRGIATSPTAPRNDTNINPLPNLPDVSEAKSLPKADATIAEADIVDIASLPKLITGHIDILQIRNGQIHILDYKPNAERERPIEQLTLYAMALSRLTGLRLFEFKCAWFDEKDYFEFYPLHVLHKPSRARRRKKVTTIEGVYNVNGNIDKIEQIRPIV